MKGMGSAVSALILILAVSLPLAAQTPISAWSDAWKAANKQWIACHLIGIGPEKLDAVEKLIVEGLVPLGFNAVVLEVDYGFQFKSHPELGTGGLNKEQARRLAEVCRQHGIRLIPLMNCLGHQSWGPRPGPLLAKYPQFDETPSIPQDDKKKGFRVLPAPWRNPESATVFLQTARQGATEKMLGVLFTGWSVSPEGLLDGLKNEPKPFKLPERPSREQTTQGVAATIQGVLKELRPAGK